MEDLAEEEWIVRASGHPTAELLLRCARSAGFQPKVAIEASDYQETQAVIAAGLATTSKANVHKSVHKRHENGPRGRISGGRSI